MRVWVDSSAAKSIASRIGLGKIRHLEVKFLWIQEVVKNKKIQVRKIRGDSNPADNLTKPKTARDMAENRKLASIGAELVKRIRRARWADVVDEEGDELGPWAC